MEPALQPSLIQINPQTWLAGLSQGLGRPATLDDVPDSTLDRLAKLGFDWVWLLSVWQTGAAGRQISRNRSDLRKQFQEALPDLREDDIIGSGFAITRFAVAAHLGGDAALARVRQRMKQRGLRLMLDFIPNHTARDHPWVNEQPDFYVQGTENDLAREPQNYVRLESGAGQRIFACGRDPNFSGWTDTLQLNYGNPAVSAAMTRELSNVASRCDGVRCDMAMLQLPDVFRRTWGIEMQPFWPEAIRRTRQARPEFCFLAEAYWNLEWDLQQQGFDYAYDKGLYDRLRGAKAKSVREHLQAGLEYQNRLARFLENHDEPRAAAVFPEPQHKAAAVIAYLSPGLKFFHQGQLEGLRKYASPQLSRIPDEPFNNNLRMFYLRLLGTLREPAVRSGRWWLLDCQSAWHDNQSFEAFVAFLWQHDGHARWLIAVNYSNEPAQCYLRLPFSDLAGRSWQLRDRLGREVYHRDGDDLIARGLYLNVSSWQAHVFEMQPASGQSGGPI